MLAKHITSPRPHIPQPWQLISAHAREVIADVTAINVEKQPASKGPVIEVGDVPPAPPPKPAASPKTGSANDAEGKSRLVQQVLTRYIAALRGERALNRIRNSVSTGTIELPLGLNGSVEIYEAAPNRSSVIMNLKGFGILQQTTDQGISWLQDPVRGYVKIGQAPAGIDTFHRELELLRRASFYRFEGKQKVGNRDCFVLARNIGDVFVERYYFDVLTGLLVRQNDLYLEDYREVEGVKIPFVARSEGTRGMGTVVRLKEVTFNVAIDESRFAERADCFTKPQQNS